MEIDLKDYLKRFGLGVRWLWLMRSLDIKTVSDLPSKLKDQKVFKELRRNVRPHEVEFFDEFIRHETRIRDDPADSQQLVTEDESFVEEPESIHEEITVVRENISAQKKCENPTDPNTEISKHGRNGLIEISLCLGLFLENAGLNPETYSNLFAAENITSLRELQILFRDKNKFDQSIKGLCEWDDENLQDLLYENLDDAVKQEEIMCCLGLLNYYPEKITLPIVMRKSTDRLGSLQDIPWYFLSKLLLLDHRGRDDVLPSSCEGKGIARQQEDVLEDLFSKLEDSALQTSFSYAFHPVDVLIVIFQCSSNFLRQILCEKLFMCKLGIPLVLPKLLNCRPLMLVWSLRGIVLKDKHSHGETFDRSAVNSPTLLISCLRLGKIQRSKSKFLNEVLNGQSYDTFFHKDCRNGMIDHTLSKDLIEIAWYLPSGKESNKELGKAVAIINHRGERRLQDPSSKLLLKVSNVILVMADISEISKPQVVSTLKSILLANSHLLLIISKGPNTVLDSKFKDSIRKCAKELESPNFRGDSIILDFTSTGDKNIKELKEEVVSKINKALSLTQDGFSLESLMEMAKSLKITVDEDIPECLESRKIVNNLLHEVESGNIKNAKGKLLPLQGTPWQEWAKLTKEEHRLKNKKVEDTIEKYMADIHYKMNEKRKEQLQLLENPNEFFKTFLDNITSLKDYSRLYYLKWLKFYLDDISMKIIPGLQRSYSSVWDAISILDHDEVPEDLQSELDILENKIAEASFGLEHLMREIGQAYEAICSSSDESLQNVREKIERLPQIMAELLVRGYALELMDGDASSVPVRWVRAVLQQLSQLIGKDKKIFVLSVLGIQSSGKSTLLNTMFGLQFSVAAGRCTRGVYAQLVPLQRTQGMQYDFILVVDTEGLRAPELGRAKLEHDNEIATLVIGLGDVTLVNIKGENVAEMEDVLQIVVHAILKMRLVNKSLNLQPSCIFIHQNVGAPDAAQKLKSGQQKFIETLNKVTKSAGEQEDAPEFTKFKQVIDFDINKHIYYFSDLWRGDPPMAPTNPGYSEKVSMVKRALMTDIIMKKGAYSTIPKISLRINDLWNGILDQNFVFSFKNSLTMRVYSIIEKQLTTLNRKLAVFRMKWLNKKENKILGYEQNLDELQSQLRQQCKSDLKEHYYKMKEELKEFFDSKEEQEAYEQWRENAFRKLKDYHKDNIYKAITRIGCLINNRKIRDERNTQMSKDELFNRAKQFADTLISEKELNESGLEDTFNAMWNDWMTNLPINWSDEEVDINKSIKNALMTKFHADQALLFKIMHEERRERIKKNFTDVIKHHIVKQTSKKSSNKNEASVINSMQKLFGLSEPEIEKLKSRVVSGKRESDRKLAYEYVKKLYGSIKSTAGKMPLQNFNRQYATSLIDLILCIVKELIDFGLEFKSPIKFAIDIAARSSWLACYEFSKRNDIQQQLHEAGKNEDESIEEVQVNSVFKEVLCETFPDNLPLVNNELEECCLQILRSINDFKIEMSKHVTMSNSSTCKKNIEKGTIKRDITKHVSKLQEEIQLYIEDSEIQEFRDEYVLNIFHSIDVKIEEIEKSQKQFRFTKEFKMRLALFICHYVIPKFTEKHERHMESVHPRAFLEKNYKKSCFEVFRDHYQQSGKEDALANVVSELIASVVERTVENDMPRVLADDVRNNVEELGHKSTLLPAILHRLLDEGAFNDFYLLISDFNLCFEKWIKDYVNKYLFHIEDGGHKTIYTERASAELEFLISEFCEEIENITEATPSDEKEDDSFKLWMKELENRDFENLQSVQSDLSRLADDYKKVDVSKFTMHLKKALESSHEKLCKIFEKHTEEHLESANEESVYSLIAEECKGCSEKCPFCNAPCALSMKDHIEQNINHVAIEHYPLACAGIKWHDDQRLLIENCPALVASDLDFENGDTNYEAHAYKDYKKLYPRWDIDSDPTAEISPYWKWFLVEYESDLAKKFKAELPKIPSEWRKVTVEMARKSLKKYERF